jgi:hypothetical protein
MDRTWEHLDNIGHEPPLLVTSSACAPFVTLFSLADLEPMFYSYLHS